MHKGLLLLIAEELDALEASPKPSIMQIYDDWEERLKTLYLKLSRERKEQGLLLRPIAK